ncbi:MAG: amino acid-binding protein [Lachnospiraceae bacterium]|nr:amino acid-binding protein [Lachnospiraceae bacterium]
MLVKQLSVFLENRPGTLDEALEILKKANINMKALALADTSEFGVMRVIADDPDKAKQAMKSAGYTSIVNEVISVELKHEVGYLSDIVKKISGVGVNIEYMYAAPSEESAAKMIIKTDDAAKAMKAIDG